MLAVSPGVLVHILRCPLVGTLVGLRGLPLPVPGCEEQCCTSPLGVAGDSRRSPVPGWELLSCLSPPLGITTGPSGLGTLSPSVSCPQN